MRYIDMWEYEHPEEAADRHSDDYAIGCPQFYSYCTSREICCNEQYAHDHGCKQYSCSDCWNLEVGGVPTEDDEPALEFAEVCI